MNKREAARLRPGTSILFGNAKYSIACTNWWTGDVIRTTDNGGVLVRVTSARDGGWNNQPGKGTYVGTERWVPYHHIHSKQG